MQPIPSVETKISWYKAVLIEVNKKQNKAIQDLLQQYLDKNGEGEAYIGVDYWDLIPEIYKQHTTDNMIYWFESDYRRGKALSRAIIKLTVTPQQELEWLEGALPELENWVGMFTYQPTCVELKHTNQLFEELVELSYDYYSAWPCDILLPTLHKYRTYTNLNWFETQEERVAAVKDCIKELKLSQNGNES